MQAFGEVRQIINLEPITKKWEDFGWAMREIDGHDFNQIEDALLGVPFNPGQPSCIIAHTIKGKGVSFMENQLVWHYWSPDHEQLQQALAELELS